MCPHVARYHVPTTSGIGALGTLVWLLTSVRPLVRRQVVGPGKDLSADLAGVRFDSRVQAHVPRQHIRAGEGPLANVTTIRFGDVIVGG